MAINWKPTDYAKEIAEDAIRYAAARERYARQSQYSQSYNDLDWETTNSSDIGRNVHDGQYHYDHEHLPYGGSASTYREAKQALDDAVIHSLVAGEF